MNTKKYLIFSIIINILFIVFLVAVLQTSSSMFSGILKWIDVILSILVLFLFLVIPVTFFYGLICLFKGLEAAKKKHLVYGVVINGLIFGLMVFLILYILFVISNSNLDFVFESFITPANHEFIS